MVTVSGARYYPIAQVIDIRGSWITVQRLALSKAFDTQSLMKDQRPEIHLIFTISDSHRSPAQAFRASVRLFSDS